MIDLDTWSPTHSFAVDLKLDLPDGLGYQPQVTAIDDLIFLSSVTEYTLRQYTFDGTLTRYIHRDVGFLTGPGVYVSGESRMMSGGYSGLSAPVQLEDGSLLVFAYWPTNVDDPNDHLRRSRNDNAEDPVHASVLDLFKPNGRYVGSLRWDDRRTPPVGRPVTVGPNGKLYTTTNDPFPQVRRYEVTVLEE